MKENDGIMITRKFHLVAAKKGSFDTIVIMDIQIELGDLVYSRKQINKQLEKSFLRMPYGKPKYLTTVRSIPDDLWDEIELLLTSGKPNNIIGRPLIPFRKVLDGINSTCIEDRVWMKDAAKRR